MRRESQLGRIWPPPSLLSGIEQSGHGNLAWAEMKMYSPPKGVLFGSSAAGTERAAHRRLLKKMCRSCVGLYSNRQPARKCGHCDFTKVRPNQRTPATGQARTGVQPVRFWSCLSGRRAERLSTAQFQLSHFGPFQLIAQRKSTRFSHRRPRNFSGKYDVQRLPPAISRPRSYTEISRPRRRPHSAPPRPAAITASCGYRHWSAAASLHRRISVNAFSGSPS